MTRIVARSIPPRVVWQLEQQGLHPLLARLYASRGVTDKAELDYELKSLLPPASLTHATDAAHMLADAIEAEARLLIIGDYDCDGATATAVAGFLLPDVHHRAVTVGQQLFLAGGAAAEQRDG